MPLNPRSNRCPSRRRNMAEMRRGPNQHVLIQSICTQLPTVSASDAPPHSAELRWYEWLNSPVVTCFLIYRIGSSRNDDTTLATSHWARGNKNTDRTETNAHTMEGLSEEQGSRDSESNGPGINPFMSWDEMGLGQEDLGFLGRFDLPDLATWFSDVPDVLS